MGVLHGLENAFFCGILMVGGENVAVSFLLIGWRCPVYSVCMGGLSFRVFNILGSPIFTEIGHSLSYPTPQTIK